MDEQYWTKMGTIYDEEIFSVIEKDKKAIVRKLIEECGSQELDATDFGCGVGNFLPFLSKSFKRITAFDLSSTCLSQAIERLNDKYNISFHQVDLSAENAVKDFPMSDFGLCVNAVMMPDYQMRKNFFNNLSDVIKPGGHLLLVVPSLESFHYVAFRLHQLNLESGIDSAESLAALEDALPKKKRRVLGGLVRLDGVATKHYIEEELKVLLKDVGFNVKRIDKIEYDWKTECVEPPASFADPYPWDWVVLAKK